MTARLRVALASMLVLALAGTVAVAQAQDTLKVAIGQINNWENQAPTLGQDAGIFKKHNLVLENFGTKAPARPCSRSSLTAPISVRASALPA